MRKLIIATLLLVIAPVAFGQTAGEPKAQVQPSENGSSQSPKGWSRTGAHRENYYLTADSKVRHGGRASATLISKNAASSDGFGSMKQEIKADDYRGKRLRYSGFVKTEIGDQHAALWMRVEGDAGKILAFDNMDSSRPVKKANGWKRYEIVLDIPDDALFIALGALFEGKGQIWVDDLKLETVGQDTGKTDMHSSPEAKREMEEDDEEYRRTHKEEFEKSVRQAKERLLTMPSRPVNFDFEN